MRATCFLVSVLLSVSACSWQSPGHSVQHSVLVLMVENLGFNSFSCGDASGPPDDVLFESFCDESVRFTHAYTPSTMSQPAIASILTGLYPREHGVRHNGAVGLSAKYETVGEAARAAGLKTSFFSGGPPIFRRSGFSQGFDVFDDAFTPTIKSLYRPALNVVNLFLDWQRAQKSGFVSFLFFADPQFVDQPTVDDLGEERESSYEGQIAEVSESIETLVKEMKHRRIWDSTTVILVGLNGLALEARQGEPGAINLFSETTRTVLMVKPAHEANPDYVKPTNWKIDTNVSLVDIGETLFEMLQATGSETSRPVSQMGTVSLLSSFSDPKANWDDDREIVVESAWPEWRGIGGVRAALRKGPYFYLFDEDDRLFNTWTDNLETRPLLWGDPVTSRLRERFSAYLRDLNYRPWHLSDRSEIERTLLGELLWRERPVASEALSRLRSLTSRFKDNEELRGWRAIMDLQHGDWADLRSIAGRDRPLWTYVADVNRGLSKVQPPSDPCFKALFHHSGERGKDCGDDLSRALALWADESKSRDVRDRAMETFNKLELSKALNDGVSRANLTAGDVWDVSRERWSEPTLTDLMLAMPDMKKYRTARFRSSARN